ncbi:hypothetical protein B0T21DRAFT_378122 [Apiosordaria backusii]|uniref:Uncharacterized protein n=1 Tax=Apiosordaria backusii TaxID=314023 RepID=A0AA39ZUX6_9PEZI|nr:hypothetical protein B0T21DRAFT_378122 [Apiosordaria backusii]
MFCFSCFHAVLVGVVVFWLGYGLERKDGGVGRSGLHPAIVAAAARGWAIIATRSLSLFLPWCRAFRNPHRAGGICLLGEDRKRERGGYLEG